MSDIVFLAFSGTLRHGRPRGPPRQILDPSRQIAGSLRGCGVSKRKVWTWRGTVRLPGQLPEGSGWDCRRGHKATPGKMKRPVIKAPLAAQTGQSCFRSITICRSPLVSPEKRLSIYCHKIHNQCRDCMCRGYEYRRLTVESFMCACFTCYTKNYMGTTLSARSSRPQKPPRDRRRRVEAAPKSRNRASQAKTGPTTHETRPVAL